MKIYINDIPVRIIDSSELIEDEHFDMVVEGVETKINPKKFIDDVLIKDASPKTVDNLLHLMTDNKLKDVDSITFSSRMHKEVIRYIKSKFQIIEAAGGVVDKGGKTLLIFRRGIWDLPKGKIDKREKKKACAVREVEEETGVKAAVRTKITSTWHTYTSNKKYILKKTHWYMMTCIDDSRMAPQVEEDIEDVKWMTLTELRAALYGSYRSIRVVIQEYHKLLKEDHYSL